MVDLVGAELSTQERETLSHPLVGGVILFERNYESLDQLKRLVDELHCLRTPSLLVAVDQEGGRVQRFRDGFTVLPPAGRIGELYDRDAAEGIRLAEASGWVMAAELRAVGVDISFAPVLDVATTGSDVIGDRAFHRTPHCVSDLASAFMQGMSNAGMSAIGKHFPGHGGVSDDSHVCLPCDHRSYQDVSACDLMPYRRLIEQGLIGVMTAHVQYVEMDQEIPTFSQYWLQQVLRGELAFNGVIFSDDLTMQGATTRGNAVSRVDAALHAGCDMTLICNDADAAAQVLDGLSDIPRDPTQRIQPLTRRSSQRNRAGGVTLDQARSQVREYA
ncbi:MAG: beta-N-acetylhexosaminidase [Gammaproteobacteria bacterium]|nr:beta-N-acetylhexosaminidase [Gammaproteobacteria bacterium]